MAEYCLKCFNKINGTNHSEKEFVFSNEFDLCEGCGKWKNVIITKRRNFIWKTIRHIIFRRYYI